MYSRGCFDRVINLTFSNVSHLSAFVDIKSDK